MTLSLQVKVLWRRGKTVWEISKLLGARPKYVETIVEALHRAGVERWPPQQQSDEELISAWMQAKTSNPGD